MANKKDKICIIGGGPAGLACAVYLEKKGYTDYTIFEKLNKVGGKAYSPKIEVNGEKRAYETGAIMGAITYHAVSEMEEFGGYYHKGPDFKPGEPNMRREYRNSFTGEITEPFNPKANFSLKKMIGLIKLKKQFKKLKELMETKYAGYDCYGHIGVAAGKYNGISKVVPNADGTNKDQAFPNYLVGENPNLKDLALPFSEFCKLNGVEEVQRIWVGPYTSFGYGYFDEIPAAYVMKYLDTTTAAEFVKLQLWTWQDGTQAIYEHVNAKLKHPAVLQTEVVKVDRADGKVNVTIKKDGKETTEVFDKLIVTTPLDWFANYADATKEEKELFSKIVHEKYVDFIARFEEGQGPVISGYLFENMEPERLGHAMVYYHRWEDIGKNCPCTVYALRNHTGDPDVPYDKTLEMMKEDINKVLKFPIKEVLYAQESYYCPHVCPKDYADGWYDKLEAIQGTKNTYYAGEIISFGDMEDTCAASKDIIGRFF